MSFECLRMAILQFSINFNVCMNGLANTCQSCKHLRLQGPFVFLALREWGDYADLKYVHFSCWVVIWARMDFSGTILIDPSSGSNLWVSYWERGRYWSSVSFYLCIFKMKCRGPAVKARFCFLWNECMHINK